MDIEDRCSFCGERLHQVATGLRINGVLVDRKRGETYVMKLSSASCSFPTRSALVFAPVPLAFLFLGNPNWSTASSEAFGSLFLGGNPPECLTSQQRTVQSAPPLTSRLLSWEKAREYTVAVCPVIFLIRRPEPRSQRLIARSSPAEARYFPSGEVAIAVTGP